MIHMLSRWNGKTLERLKVWWDDQKVDEYEIYLSNPNDPLSRTSAALVEKTTTRLEKSVAVDDVKSVLTDARHLVLGWRTRKGQMWSDVIWSDRAGKTGTRPGS